MGQLRGMLRGIAYRDGAGPAAVLAELDAAIQGLGMGTMATAAIARIEQTAGGAGRRHHARALVERRAPAAAAARTPTAASRSWPRRGRS